MMGKLILLPKENAAMKGNFNLDGEGYIQNSEHPKYVFAGIAYYNHLALLSLPVGRYSIRDYLIKWSSQKQLVGEVHHSHWCDIGSIDTWLKMR
jgi:NDP-sugar pyrophosphorylase family protein